MISASALRKFHIRRNGLRIPSGSPGLDPLIADIRENNLILRSFESDNHIVKSL